MKILSIFAITGLLVLFLQCSGQEKKSTENSGMETGTEQHKYNNELIHETSPYLLQHAHNPVNWYPWGEIALKKAKDESKLLLVSIGYSACHWCHVMEKESFEDEEVAAYMNAHFVCIKVDREERPDIDQVYMNAVQIITGRGGWPLNCFALPDGRPFYGGTYFPKKNWLYLLQNVVSEYEKDKQKIETYANQLTKDVQQSELINLNQEDVAFKSILEEMTLKWKTQFDNIEGGPNRAPKFPLPNNYAFLLDYGILSNDKEILDHVELTLDKMAMGGIYDQIGGGFSRYSTDMIWKVPHFEKMLYDNAQLISLYSKAYRYFKKPAYINVVTKTLEFFIKNELTGPNGEFYSALDADSEGEEGKFYVWTKEEIENVENVNAEIIKNFYNIKEKDAWEGKYILHQKKSEQDVAKELKMDIEDFIVELASSNMRLYVHRQKTHIPPGLDDKSLTSWNALMITGYCDAYKAMNDYDYRFAAETNANLIWEKLHQGNGKLLHNYKKGTTSIDGFLEDYSLTAQAFLDLYQINFDPIWIERSQVLTQYVLDHFYDTESNMFFFISDDQKDLVARKMEVTDNVLPSSNSVMANVLYQLGLILENNKWTELSLQMLKNISPFMTNYGSAYSNWGKLMLLEAYPAYEIAVCGEDYRIKADELNSNYNPNTIIMGSKNESQLPLLQNKFIQSKTMIYVCIDKTCQLPVEQSSKALDQITFR